MFSRLKAVECIVKDKSSAKQVEATRTDEELRVNEAFGLSFPLGISVVEQGS
jgi:hypothetical protein